MSSPALALLLALLATGANAAERYRVTVATGGTMTAGTEMGTLTVDGPRWRLEREGVTLSTRRPFHVLLSDGDEIIALDLDRKAWFVPKNDKPYEPLGAWDMPGNPDTRRVKKLRVDALPPAEEMVGGERIERRGLQLAYRVSKNLHGTGLQATVKAKVTLWVAPSGPVLPAPLDLRHIPTDIPEIDEALGKELAAIDGLVIRRELEVTRQIVGGPPLTETSVITLEPIEPASTDPSLFKPPAGWLLAPPLIATPGA